MHTPRQVTWKKLTAGLLVIGAVLVNTACSDAEAVDENSDNASEVIAVPVETTQITIGNISSNYVTTAVLEAKEEAFVVARASGIIEQIFVEEGDYVEKGQPLAQLEQERYMLSLAKARADLKGIEKELHKINEVYNQKLVSDDAFDKLTAQYESAKASVKLAELDLKETTILSPISGYVAERNAKVGNLTESFQRERMFHVVEQKQLYGILHLPEKELTRVHVNQEAYLNLAALNDQRVVANVARISPVIDSQTGTFKVTLKVSNSENVLKAGMFAQVKLNYDTHENATLLPRRALLHIDDDINVFVVKQGKAKKISIVTGYEDGEFVEVVNGLSGDEQVVTTGHHNLKDDAPVEVVNG